MSKLILPAVLKSRTLHTLVGVTLVGSAAVVWGLPPLIQSQAQTFIAKKTGHQLSVGKPQIIWTQLQVALPQLKLSTPSGETLAEFETLYVDLAGAPLFKGVIELDAIRLDGLQINASLNADGTLNWTPFLEAFKDPEPKPDTPPPAVVLGRVQVNSAAIHFEDLRKKEPFVTDIKDLNLDLKDVATRSAQAGQFQLSAKTSVDADVQLNAQIRLQDLMLAGDFKLAGLHLDKLSPLIAPLTHTGTPRGEVNVATQFAVSMPEGQPKLELTQTDVQLKDFHIASKPNGPAAQVSLSELHLPKFEFQFPELTAEVPQIQLNGLKIQQLDGKPTLELGQVVLERISLNAQAQKVAAQALHIQNGSVDVLRNDAGNLNLELLAKEWAPPIKSTEPTSDTNSATKKTDSEPWTYSIGEIAINGINGTFSDNSIKKNFSAKIVDLNAKSGPLTNNVTQPLPFDLSFKWGGLGEIQAQGKAQRDTGNVALQLTAKSIGIDIANLWIADFAKLKLADGLVSTTGNVIVNEGKFSYQGQASVSNLKLNETETGLSFFKFSNLDIPQIKVTDSSAQIPRINLKGLDTKLLIAKDRSTNISKILVTNNANNKNENTGKTAGDTKSASKSFDYNIDKFSISESNITFADESLILPFGTRINTLSGTINSINNKKGTRSAIKIAGQVDQFGQANAEGSVNLTDPTAFLDMAVRFKNVEMTSLTPYSATFANRKINSGKLSLSLDYKIENQQLNSNNQILIDRLVLGEKVNSPQATDLPLDLALALLEDADGRIDLGLPVSGSLNDPQFSYGALVWKALGNIVTKAVTAPFRALGNLFGGGGSEDVGSLSFEAGQSTLSPPQKEQLQKLAQALVKRPALQLTVNGTWSEADKKALQAAQLRRAVADAQGEKLGPQEDPGPMALQNPSTQKALESLFEKRFGGAELAALRNGYKQSNPGQLKESMLGGALSQITGLVKPPRTLSASELAALKGTSFHQVLANRLQDSEAVSPARLNQLGKGRQTLVIQSLRDAGGPLERVLAGNPRATEKTTPDGIPMNLEVKTQR